MSCRVGLLDGEKEAMLEGQLLILSQTLQPSPTAGTTGMAVPAGPDPTSPCLQIGQELGELCVGGPGEYR